MTPCSICARMWRVKASINNKLVQFVCRICRCCDCQIVFDVECDCGEVHAVRSKSEPERCTDCIEIRNRVANANLDEELLELRKKDIDAEKSLT